VAPLSEAEVFSYLDWSTRLFQAPAISVLRLAVGD